MLIGENRDSKMPRMKHRMLNQIFRELLVIKNEHLHSIWSCLWSAVSVYLFNQMDK